MASSPPAPVVLASASPRRRELLSRAGVRFEVRPAHIPEERGPGEQPASFARRLARDKALAVARELPADASRLVLGADTIVVTDSQVLGKPRDPDHAVELLRQLVGRDHRVITAVAVVAPGGGPVQDAVVESTVRMRDATVDELRAYVATGESLDKAGAYALQGEGRRFVERVTGSETNVIGLPVEETLGLLRSAGWVDGS